MVKPRLDLVGLSLLIILFLISCGRSGSSDLQQADLTEEDENQNSTREINVENIKSIMTLDVLGGVFRKTSMDANSMIVDSISTNKVSENRPPIFSAPYPSDQNQNETDSDRNFEIDFSNQYVGYNGHGRLILSAFGSGEEINNIRHFSSLALRFLFHNYAFYNPCVSNVYLDGEVHCEIYGDYEVETKNFLGNAHCTNGLKEEPIPILYIIGQTYFEIGFDAQLGIDGNIYQYRSYSYEGEITIDGERQNIEDLLEQGRSCS